MTEAQYLAVCDACDAVLLAPDSTVNRVAIPWLHVVREHPAFLIRYADLIDDQDGATGSLALRWARARRTLEWLTRTARAWRPAAAAWCRGRVPGGSVDAVFVSHLVSASHAGQEVDFYFGDIPRRLVELGYSVCLVLMNHTAEPASMLAEKWRGSTVARAVLTRSLRVGHEIQFYRRLRRESRTLRLRANAEPDGLTRKAYLRAAEEALSGEALATLRLARQIEEIVGELRPKAVVVTHEGHASERIVWSSARKARPGVRCVGYQHAALFRLQHAIRRPLAPEYNPDELLTAGSVGKGQLERSPRLQGIPIAVLGSGRGFVPGQNDPRNARRLDNSSGQPPTCLVLPEGIPSECHLLFEFSLECARLCPGIRFIWRLHPIVPFETLRAKNRRFRRLAANVALSGGTFEQDLEQSRWALYRGTTAIVRAVGGGLTPIYVRIPGEITIDPLYELSDLKPVVTTSEEFRRITQEQNGDRQDPWATTAPAVQRYCEQMFLPFDTSALCRMLGAPFRNPAAASESDSRSGCPG